MHPRQICFRILGSSFFWENTDTAAISVAGATGALLPWRVCRKEADTDDDDDDDEGPRAMASGEGTETGAVEDVTRDDSLDADI